MNDQLLKMKEALQFIEDQGGFLRVNTSGPDGNEKIQSIVFTTAKQLADIERDGSATDVCLLDLTYGCCSEKYKTAAIVYPCPRTGGTRIACTALLVDETSLTMEQFLTQFKTILQPKFFFVDKDFGQLEVLNRFFPTSRVLLCAFHVIKYIANLFATMHSTRHRDMILVKKNLFQLFKRMVNSYNQVQFDESWSEFRSKGLHCTVRSGKSVVPLIDYLEKNWISCVEM